MHRAQLDLAGAGGDLADHGRDHRPGGLARAVGVERPNHGHRRAEGGVEAEGDLVGADLGSRIGRLPLQGMRFGHRHEPRGAIDLAGRGVDDALDTQVPRRLHDIQRAEDIGLNIGLGRMVAVGNGDQGGQVQDNVAPGHRGAHAVRIADVAGEDVQIPADVRRTVVQPAPRPQAVVLDEGAHLATPAYQPFGQVGADEAIGAGDQYALAVQLHRSVPRPAFLQRD